MRCPSCNCDNQPTAKFCVECGSGFQTACVKCDFKNPPAARFCQECGVGLTAPDQAPVPETSPVQPREVAGERRHLTVLFCDLVGSTSVAAQLDPEEWRETVAGYHRTAAEAITRFGGHVAKYLGDGVMAFFGYPEAHDNDAERAARAGLAIIDAIAKLNEQPGRPKLAARVGIHSGTVVVGAGAGKDADVFGDAPNIAARVQEAAAPGTVVVTEDTHRLISGLFVVDARGAPTLKGIERPIQLYRVIQPSGVRGRLEAAAAARGLTPFVGREDELRSLMNRWERALDGEGQVALIIGEAGIGKSRLVQRFHEQIAGTPHTWIEAAAAPFFQNTPFYLVAEMLRELLAWRGDEPAEEQLAQLEAALVMAGLQPAEAIPLITPLLNLPIPVKYPRSPLPPEQQRRRLLATLVDLALGTARVQADRNRDRRFALGRPFDDGTDPSSPRAGGDSPAAAPVHGAPRVSRPMADAGPSYANHAQPAERPQRAYDGGAGGGPQGIAGGDYRCGRRAHRRSTAVRRGVDAGGARERRCATHRARDPGNVA